MLPHGNHKQGYLYHALNCRAVVAPGKSACLGLGVLNPFPICPAILGLVLVNDLGEDDRKGCAHRREDYSPARKGRRETLMDTRNRKVKPPAKASRQKGKDV